MSDKKKQSRLSNLFLGFALGMYLGPKLVKKLKQTELTENERLKLFALNMRDATLDVIESLRNYLDSLGIEPSKDIFEDIDNHHGVEHEVELEGEWQMVNSFHTVGIASLAEELVAIAMDREYNIEAFKHKEKRIWGVVWHPERMDKPILPKEIKELLNSA